MILLILVHKIGSRESKLQDHQYSSKWIGNDYSVMKNCPPPQTSLCSSRYKIKEVPVKNSLDCKIILVDSMFVYIYTYDHLNMII